jgi:zinc finger CCHC domain-containing protein 9
MNRHEINRIVAECRERGMNEDDTQMVLKKYKRREYRRLKRQNDRERKHVCYNCRKSGHQLADCPEVLGTREFAVGVCFKCGSTEHTVAECRLKIKNFPYAKCFVCGQSGHLSRNCEENPNGAFPDGGSCKECGALNHLRKDCPKLMGENGKEGKRQFVLTSMDHTKSADDDSFAFLEEDDSVQPATNKKRTKVVKF